MISRFSGGRGWLAAGALAVLAVAPACKSPTGPEPPPSLAALSVTPPSVVGGNLVQLVATLSAPAPGSGARIGLVSSDAAAPVPSGLVMAAGETSGSVSITTSQVVTSRSVTLTASYLGVSQSVALQVTP